MRSLARDALEGKEFSTCEEQAATWYSSASGATAFDAAIAGTIMPSCKPPCCPYVQLDRAFPLGRSTRIVDDLVTIDGSHLSAETRKELKDVYGWDIKPNQKVETLVVWIEYSWLFAVRATVECDWCPSQPA